MTCPACGTDRADNGCVNDRCERYRPAAPLSQDLDAFAAVFLANWGTDEEEGSGS